MNSIYKDDFYENLDFISQATEPFVDNVESLYSNFPDIVKLSKEHILKSATTDPRYASIDMLHSCNSAITETIAIMKASNPSKFLTELSDYVVDPVRFKLLFEIELHKDTEIDIFTGESSHDIFLKKKKTSIDNEDLLEYAMHRLQHFYRWNYFDYKYYERKRILELCDIFGIASSTRSKDNRSLGFQLREGIYVNIQNNLFRIRKYEVMKSIAEWCDSYVKTGDLAAYTNLTRFKLMTHSGKAIYSIQEVL